MAFRKMDCVRKLYYLAQEIGARTETLQDAGDLLPSRSRSPKVIGCGGFAGGFRILNNSDLRRGLAYRLGFFRWFLFVHGFRILKMPSAKAITNHEL
jgi:hypothetical protein